MRIFQLPRRHRRCTSFVVGFVDDGSHGSQPHPAVFQYVEKSPLTLCPNTLCVGQHSILNGAMVVSLSCSFFLKVGFLVSNHLARGLFKFINVMYIYIYILYIYVYIVCLIIIILLIMLI